MKKSLFPLFAAAVMGLLLFYPVLSFQGAKAGLLLWFHTVLPTLLPFMLCSSAIAAFGAVPVLTRPMMPFFSHMSLSENGSYALMTGILCGYPMGPKTTADFLTAGGISREEAQYLLAISAWPSPMFLSGYVRSLLPPSLSFAKVLLSVYLPMFLIAVLAWIFYQVPKPVKPMFLSGYVRSLLPPSLSFAKVLLSVYLPMFLIAVLAWIFYQVPKPVKQKQHLAKQGTEQIRPLSFDEILMDCLEIMAKIGGYLMIFSIFSAFVTAFSPEDFFLRPYFLGLIEMTTGIREMASSGLSPLLMGAGMVGAAVFGGLSGIFQVSAVIQKNAGLSIRHYVLWKLAHLLLSTSLFILLSLAE